MDYHGTRFCRTCACVIVHVAALLTLAAVAAGDSGSTGVIPVARCRAHCVTEFLPGRVSDDECEKSKNCVWCWNVCEQIFSQYEVWKDTCGKKALCKRGCQTACDFRKYFPQDSNPERWVFQEIPAMTTYASKRASYMAWHNPVRPNSVPDSQSKRTNFIFVLLSRENLKMAGKGNAWQQTLQTSSTEAVLDLLQLPYDPEFWLLAVGEEGTVAQIRFNSTISDQVPWDKGVIPVGDSLPSRYGDGAVIEYNSTLNLTFTMPVIDGRLVPRLAWTNPEVVARAGKRIEYQVDLFLNQCDCDRPPNHMAELVVADATKQPDVTFDDIAFNAEYHVKIYLFSQKEAWHGEIKFYTPTCEKTLLYNDAQCESGVQAATVVNVRKTTTPFPKTTLENIGTGQFAAIKKDGNELDMSLVHGGYDDASPHGLDWNLTATGKAFDEQSSLVAVDFQWSEPFDLAQVGYRLVWANVDHSRHVDGGRHMYELRGTSHTLHLRPYSIYEVFATASYTDDGGTQHEVRSRSVRVSTNVTDDMPLVAAAKTSVVDNEKEILNGIILGVTVVSSLIIVGIIVLFVYKKRQSFRDIMLTKTAVAKSNSYKSNVGCKVDYSNQILITNDDWEIDCHQLKFASHIGQGAFGKVVTGYYQSERVAIKLVRDCAPLSYKEDLLAEISLMKRIGSHPNIVSMIGACTMTEPICLVMEYAPYGNLQNFLKKCRLEGELSVQAGRSPELNYSLMDEHGGLNEGVVKPADLLSFARQVSMAMEYLAEKKYVHRDLAARNVLLGYDKIIKVCDFGLSRDIFADNQYKKLTNGKLPLKWMAIESLRDRVFTTQSDVWSFGILLWEIVTMGASPYPNIALADLYYLLSNNYRMDKPSNCSDEVYIIMRQCWLETPVDRPNFTDLRVQLELLLSRDRNYLELDNINVPLSTPESSSGSPVSDDTKSLLAAQALQPPRKLSKDELTVSVSIHDKSVEKILKRKSDLDSHNITFL
ncbi:uncharacterized protein LOC128207355 [Mya arenaria]|nr:uncharacterized protein LOC128207355 [Mya arenaria]XP_052766192.1 uncharacterized protein LOC128207355 [Mya arenaria]